METMYISKPDKYELTHDKKKSCFIPLQIE